MNIGWEPGRTHTAIGAHRTRHGSAAPFLGCCCASASPHGPLGCRQLSVLPLHGRVLLHRHRHTTVRPSRLIPGTEHAPHHIRPSCGCLHVRGRDTWRCACCYPRPPVRSMSVGTCTALTRIISARPRSATVGFQRRSSLRMMSEYKARQSPQTESPEVVNVRG